ncbi:MAG: DUF1622 domain-containing protein [Erysipelotrichaceae bacterium]|nr:DUF1622 domain-containing protein [Erysipelotrichaceae bacterium]
MVELYKPKVEDLWFKEKLLSDEDTRITLAKGLAMGLEFKLGSEILRTVVVREWKEISIVAGIILLRADVLNPLGNKTGRKGCVN